MNDFLSQLATVVARRYRLFDAAAEIRTHAQHAGLAAEQIDTTGAPLSAWTSFLRFAQDQNALKSVLDILIQNSGGCITAFAKEIRLLYKLYFEAHGTTIMLPATDEERWEVPAWLLFTPPEFSVLTQTIPDGTVRIVRTLDINGNPGSAELVDRLCNGLSLLVFQGPRLCGKTWHAREVVAALSRSVRKQYLLIYVHLSSESYSLYSNILSQSLKLTEERTDRFLPIFAFWAHLTIDQVLHGVLSPDEQRRLKRDKSAEFLVRASIDFQFVLHELLHRATNSPGKRRIDLTKAVIIDALRQLPLFSNENILLVIEADDAEAMLSLTQDGLGDSLWRAVLGEINLEARDPLRRTIKPYGNAKDDLLKLLITTQYPDMEFGQRDVRNRHHPLCTVGLLDHRDFVQFLDNNCCIRTELGESVIEILTNTQFWPITNGHPWFLMRFLQGLAFLRSKWNGWHEQDAAGLAVRILLESTRLWVFHEPFEEPQHLTSETFPDLEMHESLFLKLIADLIDEEPNVLGWLESGMPPDGRGTLEERTRFALPLVKIGFIRVNPATGEYELTNQVIERHLSAARLKTYCANRHLFWAHD